MKLDDIERLARESIDRGGMQTYENTLARALLAVLPVVRAAEVVDGLRNEQHELSDLDYDQLDGMVVDGLDAMTTAIEAMRARLAEGNG